MKCPYCGREAKPPKCDYCKAAISQPEKKATNINKPKKEEK